MSAIYSLSWESWLAYVAFTEGNFPQCDPQYVGLWWDNPTSSPNNVGTSHALPRSFPSLHPGNNNGFFIENPLLIAYLFPCYLPNQYPCIFANPIPTSLLGYLPTLIPYNLICLFKK